MERKAHFFFALSLPKEIKYKMKDACLNLKGNFPFHRWVHHEDYHITLAFLGSAPAEKLQDARRLVEEGLKGQKSFPLQIHQLGVFGKGDNPRIFWADTVKEERLSVIRDIVFSACLRAGFELETRSFKPHITLARKWPESKPFQGSLLNDQNPFQDSPLHFKANEVVLYQTHLDQTPKYERMAIFPLMDE
ncbi:RNA 2',3'-cyclic phosphodiesterase [Bacillus sp. FJAT-29790]|uniref:RNA 2',3'-cyclic phosphodiesterase n=1 Tax=Bacillus sp. FJAT-29790 TaxID=1895002 RepID=UPI001C21CD84|nr:RNA 2',3'-cyclic phosphodiesterase [Bacillus sp. FJAT-29790]MBU8879787.1 RNA 2',3'-cyclic phosphodiesterase [Bacillus sp. FJAT-29790]